jgi:protein SCO1/2
MLGNLSEPVFPAISWSQIGGSQVTLLVYFLLASVGQTANGLAEIGPAPDFALKNQAGKEVRLAHLRGKVVLVSFIYTTCGGVCPATTHRLSRVQDELKKKRLWDDSVQFVSITLDPERDTPEVLTRYAATYDADTVAWHFLTGRPEQVAAVVAAWGMWARKNELGVIDHPSRIFLVDREGRQREIYSLDYLDPTAVVSDVEALR